MVKVSYGFMNRWCYRWNIQISTSYC